MDSTCKKREGNEIQSKDLLSPQIKRLKGHNQDHLAIFLKSLSLLSDEKKAIICKLGFSSILSFHCSSNINDVFLWLVKYFDTNRATVTLENGFSFCLSPTIVHKILGFPYGGKSVQLTATKESTAFIQKYVQMECPSVDFLSSLLSNELDEPSFTVIFMQLLLAAFIAPNGKGTASPLYYTNLMDQSEIPNIDWCSFILNWLLMHINKLQRGLLEGSVTEIGGCKIILVICYFEFLITSEFNLGSSVPRLPLWSTHVVNSYIALDSMHGSKRIFGRLARKHISSTPFRCSIQSCSLEMPTEILEYINHKFKGTFFSTEKSKLESLAQNFFKNMVQNSVPTMKCYIDDVVNTSCLPNDVSAPISVAGEKEKLIELKSNQPMGKSNQVELSLPAIPNSNPWFHEKEVQKMIQNIESKLTDYPEDSSTELMFKNLVSRFSKDCTLDDETILKSMPISEEFEKSLYPQPVNLSELMNIEPCEDIVQYIMKEIQVRRRQLDTNMENIANYKFSSESISFNPAWQNLDPVCNEEWEGHYDANMENIANYKFSSESISFHPAGQNPDTVCKEERSEQLDPNMENTAKYKSSSESISFHPAGQNPDPVCNEETFRDTMFKLSHHSIQEFQNSTTPASKTKLAGLQFSSSCHSFKESIYVSAPTPNLQKIVNQSPCWGFSLNERCLGKRIEPVIQEEFPSFDILGEESGNENLAVGNFQKVDPLSQKNFHQSQEGFMQSQRMTSERKASNFIPSSPLPIAGMPKQVIFSNEFEKAFYDTLTKSNHDFSPRIFELNLVWIDQRTLAKSMSPGGWIHPHVIDCFGMLTTTDQNYRIREGKSRKGEILKHIVIKDTTKLLMTPSLNYDDPKYKRLFGLNNVGFRMENAGLVHIPIPNDKQWILIVANFIDGSFDVLNSDYSIEKFASLIRTVIFNFKELFRCNFPGCRFNIRDFKVRYVPVSKHNFRYDSGIFVMQNIRWYNGIEVKPFSNHDVQAIREKISCQLVINDYNENQVQLTRDFLSKNAPGLLR